MTSIRLHDRVKQLFATSIESHLTMADTLANVIVAAGSRLVNCLLEDGKIFLCGSGGSAANCLHFTSAMLNHFEVERPPLPVVMLGTDLAVLTAVTDEGQVEHRFARQLQALGRENDVLLVLTTVGNSNGLLSTVTEAHDRGMDVIALTGFDGGLLANHLGPEDIELRVPSESMPRIQEMHLFILHCFCDLIDQALFGSG